jgi:hypothetical protein
MCCHENGARTSWVCVCVCIHTHTHKRTHVHGTEKSHGTRAVTVLPRPTAHWPLTDKCHKLTPGGENSERTSGTETSSNSFPFHVPIVLHHLSFEKSAQLFVMIFFFFSRNCFLSISEVQFAPDGGDFFHVVTAGMMCDTPGADIYYSLTPIEDISLLDSEPSCAEGVLQEFAGPVTFRNSHPGLVIVILCCIVLYCVVLCCSVLYCVLYYIYTHKSLCCVCICA